MKIDYGLYVLTDSMLAHGRAHCDVVGAALRGGATLVQYREKDASTARMIEEALALRSLCHASGVPLIVNDRVDLALAVEADGVHLGPDDMPVSLARRLLGPRKILGVSAGNVDEARAAIAAGADYLGVGALFATVTKADAGEPIGIQGLRQIAQISTVPVVGIAGINRSNAVDVIRAGAAGIAVVSAVVGAEDVECAARGLRAIVEESRAGREI